MQSNEPYIGSVRFFKNIIFLCCILGVLIPTGLALRWRSRAKTAESLLAQNAVVLTGEEDEAASEAEAASAETEPEADSSDEQEPLSYQLLYPDFYAPTPLPDIEDYEKIYTSVEDFLDDFYKLFVILRDEAGVTPTVFRFPGGSLNNYNQGVYKEIIAEMLRRGFRYYDWNLSAEDAAKKSPSASTIVEGITSYSAQKKHGVVLMHDSAHCKTTVEALPALIDTLREQGFDFAPLDRTVRQVSFHYRSASNQS